MQIISRKRMGQIRKTYVTLVIIIVAIFSMGNTDSMNDRYKFNDQIQAELKRSYERNRRPSPSGGPRAMRHARNRYRNCCTKPILPKTIYREPVHVPPNQHQRFYGGIPRG